jgi:hypothetical protein
MIAYAHSQNPTVFTNWLGMGEIVAFANLFKWEAKFTDEKGIFLDLRGNSYHRRTMLQNYASQGWWVIVAVWSDGAGNLSQTETIFHWVAILDIYYAGETWWVIFYNSGCDSPVTLTWEEFYQNISREVSGENVANIVLVRPGRYYQKSYPRPTST